MQAIDVDLQHMESALVLPISAAANVDIVDTTIAGTDKSRGLGL